MAVGEARRTRRGGATVDSIFYATNHECNVIHNNAPKKSADAFSNQESSTQEVVCCCCLCPWWHCYCCELDA